MSVTPTWVLVASCCHIQMFLDGACTTARPKLAANCQSHEVKVMQPVMTLVISFHSYA